MVASVGYTRFQLSGCLGWVHSLSAEWLPRWGAIAFRLSGCLGGLPRWGRGGL